MTATEFKAKCLSVIDLVHKTGEVVTITKRGKAVARLVADHTSDCPWLELRESQARWTGDPLAPVVDEEDVEAAR